MQLNFIDEFQIEDVADAMIITNILENLDQVKDHYYLKRSP